MIFARGVKVTLNGPPGPTVDGTPYPELPRIHLCVNLVWEKNYVIYFSCFIFLIRYILKPAVSIFKDYPYSSPMTEGAVTIETIT